ncbi:ras-related protein Rab-23 isoform X3 [Hydra vulgaris]|uniref:Ras-related protein Rab-23 isoform X3 n=1 Tax=Hydra vulgaris TaxID=6087 RepID=A0ABM4D6P4_HYDVU
MREEDLEISIKVVVVGNGAVGKSSMIQRYCKGYFSKEYKKTIGVDFLEKMISVNGEDVRLMLWDTAGQEEFDAITKAYYRGAQACVLTFSVVDYASYAAIVRWKEKVVVECGANIPMVLVQNKMDLIESAVVRQEDAENLAKSLQVNLYCTSVKENVGVSDVFDYLAKCYIQSLSSAQVEALPQIAAPARSSPNKSKSQNIVLKKQKLKKKTKFCFNF